MEEQSKYNARGVSAGKEDVHKAIKGMDKGLYPSAFCKIMPDIVAGNSDFVNIMHADTAGTKTALAYLYYKETGDTSIWKGIVQDAIVMNTDDMACVGCLDDIILNSTIGRNKHLINAECLEVIIQESKSFVNRMAEHGVKIYLSGGETADVGDIVRTADVGFTAFARMPKEKLIINRIRPGQVIVGLASYGQASYESEYNSGIGSNGLTMARHELFGADQYRVSAPETFAPETVKEFVYSGPYRLTDKVNIEGKDYEIGRLALSPTRTFLPVLKKILTKYHGKIQGIIHNTGGAHSKVLKYLDTPVRIVKDNLLPVPPLFNLIQKTTGTSWQEMFQVFNMGTRLEIYTDEALAQGIIDIAQEFNIAAEIICRVEDTKNSSEVIVNWEGCMLLYN